MTNQELIVYLLPFVFIIHDFEEIIGYHNWFKKHGEWLKQKWPRMDKFITHFQNLPTSSFAIGVLEEFLIISLITIHALLFHWYYAWIAVFTAFTFHIIMHVIQWCIIRKYIPVIITSLLSVPYVVWGLKEIFSSYHITEIIICFLIGVTVTILNLLLIHRIIPQIGTHE